MGHKVTCVLLMVLMLALSTLAQSQEETCEMSPHQRVNCGYPGVTSEECTKRGCCFKDTPAGYPWCFHPVVIDSPTEEECPF